MDFNLQRMINEGREAQMCEREGRTNGEMIVRVFFGIKFITV